MSRFTSRKFLLALANLLIVTLNEVFGFGIDEQAYMAISGPVIAYIAGEALIDTWKKR